LQIVAAICLIPCMPNGLLAPAAAHLLFRLLATGLHNPTTPPVCYTTSTLYSSPILYELNESCFKKKRIIESTTRPCMHRVGTVPSLDASTSARHGSREEVTNRIVFSSSDLASYLRSEYCLYALRWVRQTYRVS
jgi:hypothetical protein